MVGSTPARQGIPAGAGCHFVLRAILLGLLGLLPSAVLAQDASITGVVRDVSGAVMPGVTVEATSEALTEKVRTVTSDGNGQYRIVSLPVGTYSVSFTLPGFNIVKRDGVVLTGTLTATIDAELRVGTLEETVTVTGESPIVDVQSARHEQVMSSDVAQALPSARSVNSLIEFMPGVTGTPAGDTAGQVQLTPTMTTFTTHGGSTLEGRMLVDGVSVGSSRGGGGQSSYVPDVMNVQEITMTMSGALGESETGGPQMNVIPRTGTNRFSGAFAASGLNRGMQGDNLTDRLKAAGLTVPQEVLSLYDVQASVGGPVLRDRIWFFYNHRSYGMSEANANLFANKNAGDPTKWLYEPDLEVQSRRDLSRRIDALRLTIQATPRNKFTLFYDNQPYCEGAAWDERENDACRVYIPGKDGWISGGGWTERFFPAGPAAPESGNYASQWQKAQQVKWQSPISNRLLADADFGFLGTRWGYDERPGNITRDLVRVVEQAGALPGLKYRSSNFPSGRVYAHTWKASVSYVTGAHNVKVGYQGAFLRDTENLFTTISNTTRTQYRFQNGVPNQITIDAGEYLQQRRTKWYAFYAQEQWTLGRLTLQGALRYDHARSYFPEQVIGPSRFIPSAIVIPHSEGVLGFNDISPRVGVAYDLFGNARTALKLNVGRYLSPASNAGRFVATNPADRIVTNTTRPWNDRNNLGINGDYVPQCDLMNPLANGECGQFADLNFGNTRPSTVFDPALLEGWGSRPDDWQIGVSVQQQIAPRVSMEVSYNRRWWNRFQDATDNIITTAADYDAFTLTAPLDPRLPGGGGYTVGPLYDVRPALAGQASNVVYDVDKYGKYVRYWHGVDVNFVARLQAGLTVQGGTSTGRLIQNTCDIRTSLPEFNLLNYACDTAPPFRTDFRGLATYTIPRVDVQTSVTLVSRPGVELSANVIVPTAVVAQSLGRPLSGGTANITVNMLQPGDMYGDWVNQLDVRVGKIVRVGTTRFNVSVDILNSLNSDAILAYTPLLNATWPTPNVVLKPRIARVNVGIDW
jgi:hypothetical protein